MFEQIREQIHEIRNIIGPVHLKLADMEHRIVTSKAYLEERTLSIESKLLAAIFRLDKQDKAIADIVVGQQRMVERVKRLET